MDSLLCGLSEIADELDSVGLSREASAITDMMVRFAQSAPPATPAAPSNGGVPPISPAAVKPRNSADLYEPMMPRYNESSVPIAPVIKGRFEKNPVFNVFLKYSPNYRALAGDPSIKQAIYQLFDGNKIFMAGFRNRKQFFKAVINHSPLGPAWVQVLNRYDNLTEDDLAPALQQLQSNPNVKPDRKAFLSDYLRFLQTR